MYAGRTSHEYGLYNINLDSGMMQDIFTSSKRINEVSVRGNDKPYFQGKRKEPLSFSLSFSIYDYGDFGRIDQVAKWLCEQEYYQPLVFTPNIHKIYYVMFVNNSDLFYTSEDGGYINLTARANAPYAYSPFFITKEYQVVGSVDIKINNAGQLPIYPEIYITMPNEYSAGISINNLTNGNEGLSVDELNVNEELYINCDKQFITTSVFNTYRYSNMEGDFIKLLPGVNRLKLQGYGQVYFRYQCKLI